MPFLKTRKQRQDVSIDEYLTWCQDELTLEEYLAYEQTRVKTLFHIDQSNWCKVLMKQSMKCYYCNTDLRIIQHLILNGLINPRKRGPDGYSGLHFELDHKNCDKGDNSENNIVASCYYCNNDKSNTISCETFKQYFGLHKNAAFNSLFSNSGLSITSSFRHHLKGKKI